MLSKNDFRNLVRSWRMKTPAYKKITLKNLINGEKTQFPVINNLVSHYSNDIILEALAGVEDLTGGGANKENKQPTIIKSLKEVQEEVEKDLALLN